MAGFPARDLNQPMDVVLRPLPQNGGAPRITVCTNVRPENHISVSCGPRGGIEIADGLRAEIMALGLDIEVVTIKCLGLCQKGPNVRLAPGNSWFHGVRPGDVAEVARIVARHVGDS